MRPLLRIAADVGLCGVLDFRFGREFVSAARAFGCGQRDDLVAFGTGLGRRFAVAIAGLAVDAGIVDRTEAADIAGEVEHQASVFAVRLAGAAADLLHVKPGRAGWPQQRDQIDKRNVEPVGENHHRDDAGQPPGAELLDDAIAFIVIAFRPAPFRH